jgi:hypothetical protein
MRKILHFPGSFPRRWATPSSGGARLALAQLFFRRAILVLLIFMAGGAAGPESVRHLPYWVLQIIRVRSHLLASAASKGPYPEV